jgi:molecular chaperone HscB
MEKKDLTSNYYELFQLPVSFVVDLNALSDRYRTLQSSIHPDKYANAGDFERRLSVQQSARINEAFQTLKNPLSRARYLLKLNGIDMDSDSDTSMDPIFLMQQMELRERLEAVQGSANPGEVLLEVNHDIDEILEGIIRELKTIFAGTLAGTPVSDLQAARDCVRRMQFMTRLQEEAEVLEETLL